MEKHILLKFKIKYIVSIWRINRNIEFKNMTKRHPAFIGSYFIGLRGVFAALTISYFVAGIISKFVLNKIILSKEKSNKATSS